MIITREHQEAMLNAYIKAGNNPDKSMGFIDGMEAMFELISKKIEDDRTTKTI